MPNIQLTKLKNQNHEGPVRAKILSFLQKLAEDDTSNGLHIEKMAHQADPKARTGRVDQALRAVLYRIDRPNEERLYVYAGTWPHDEAIRRAKTLVLQVNPINGIPEFVASEVPSQVGAPAATATSSQVEIEATDSSKNLEDEKPVTPEEQHEFLRSLGYLLIDLTEKLGFDADTAEALFGASSEDALLDIAATFENEWQVNAALMLATGESIDHIRDQLAISDDTSGSPKTLVEAFELPASKMQFTYVENDEELRGIIEGGDFGAWRVFLHPEQRKYAEQFMNGSFRLTGGAGTGKTVVLLHRARNLATTEPNHRIILTTFTKALASALARDLERLDAKVTLASNLGGSGVYIRGVDQLASDVRAKDPALFWASAAKIFGYAPEPRSKLVADDVGWREAIDDLVEELPANLKQPSFFEAEYVQIVLPGQIQTQEQYFQARRPGRGVALDRHKRALVWQVVQNYRKASEHLGRVSFSETAAIAAATLEAAPDMRPADSVLIDEAQDLSPVHWNLLRALAEPGPNDLFIAEDSHQRIYGQRVVLSRYGIKIVGRSRRLTLNYRTTQQNLRFALGILSDADFVDSEETEEERFGYRSSRRGPEPQTLACQSDADQFDKIAGLLNTWLEAGVEAQSIVVLCRSNSKRDQLKAQLADRGVETTVPETGQARSRRIGLMTMHKSKGMEFSRVILFDVSDGSIPNPAALQHIAPEEQEDFLLRERSLLYVASSRARDELVVSWQGEPSELLGAVV